MIEKLIEENIKSKCFLSEARHYTGYSIERVSDGSIGKIVKSLIHGNAYEIEWENGKTQKLGRNTLTNDKKYILNLKEDDGKDIKDNTDGYDDVKEKGIHKNTFKSGKFGKIYDVERQKKIRKRIDKYLEKMKYEKWWNQIAMNQNPEKYPHGIYEALHDPILIDENNDININNNIENIKKCLKGIFNTNDISNIVVRYCNESNIYNIVIYDNNMSEKDIENLYKKIIETDRLKIYAHDYHIGYNGLFIIRIQL